MAKPRNAKIPATVNLPGGYDITVLIMSAREADKEMGNGVFAEWAIEGREIHLRASRRGQDRREDFIHEMEHAMVDWKDFFLGKTEIED